MQEEERDWEGEGMPSICINYSYPEEVHRALALIERLTGGTGYLDPHPFNTRQSPVASAEQCSLTAAFGASVYLPARSRNSDGGSGTTRVDTTQGGFPTTARTD